MHLHVKNDASNKTDLVKTLGTVAVLGYGSQGRAHAMNLRDSGISVVIGARPSNQVGRGYDRACEDGFKPVPIETAVKEADLVAILLPDTAQPDLFVETIAPSLKEGAAVLFAHGFNVRYGRISVPKGTDCVMVAPKGPGALVRRQYEEGSGVPCLYAIDQDATGKARDRVLAYAEAIGGMRAGVLETTFAEETETDLFGEQAVLCGGATELVVAGFETLTEAGYQPEVAYFECLHELKLIVDLLYEGGMARMHRFVSDTAKFGDLTRGKRVIDASTRERMKIILEEIQSGTFAKEWVDEDASGRKNYNAMIAADMNHPIEEVGKRLRANMPWLPTEDATPSPTAKAQGGSSANEDADESTASEAAMS